MATDDKVLAELDCFHRFHRFCRAESESVDGSRYEAWLDYKLAIIRRDQQTCSVCGQVRPLAQLDVRVRPGPVGQEMAPDNLACVCIFCQQSAGLIRTRRRVGPSERM